jgi:Na+/phosphate symporter
MGSMVLLDLMGGVALLLWGLHMVQSGILWVFGPSCATCSRSLFCFYPSTSPLQRRPCS